MLIRPTQATPYFIYGMGNTTSGAGNGYLFSTGNAYRSSIATGNWSTEQTVNSGANLARGVWKTITYTLDDATNTARIYLDGVQVAQNTNVTTTPGSIGGGVTTANYLGRSVYYGRSVPRGQPPRLPHLRRRAHGRGGRGPAARRADPGRSRRRRARPRRPVGGRGGCHAADLRRQRLRDHVAVERPRGDLEHGRRHPPAASAGDAAVTLTATLTTGGASATTAFRRDRARRGRRPGHRRRGRRRPRDHEHRRRARQPDAPGAPRRQRDHVDRRRTRESSRPTGSSRRPAADTEVTLTATVTRKGAASADPRLRRDGARGRRPRPLEGYAFAYFTGNSLAGEKIYFAASKGDDALDWTELNGGQPVLTSKFGTKGLRDPFIIRSPEGDTFYLIATDLSIGGGTSGTPRRSTGSKYIEVWESTDLVNWSDAAPRQGLARHRRQHVGARGVLRRVDRRVRRVLGVEALRRERPGPHGQHLQPDALRDHARLRHVQRAADLAGRASRASTRP